MQIQINDVNYNLSQEAEHDLLLKIQEILRSCPVPIEQIKNYDLITHRSISPYIFAFIHACLTMYGEMSNPRKLLIMTAVRQLLWHLEAKFGGEMRPPRKADPVIHFIEYVGKRLIHEAKTIEETLLSNAKIVLETNGTEITHVSILWNANSEGRAVAAHGRIGIGEDNSREED